MKDKITHSENKKDLTCDFCVIGGGLAGTIAALSAARKGLKVVLMQDRPVLGGNCSSEVRLYIRGAIKFEDRETGILNEFEEENIYRNSELSNSIWDSVLLGKVYEEKNITLFCNCTCLGAEVDKNKIISVTGWQLNTYTWIKVSADYFADCSGDAILSTLTGASFIVGEESRDVYNESFAPIKPSGRLMGMSCLLQARETDTKVDFIPPKWANVYKTDDDIGQVCGEKDIRCMRSDYIGTDGNNLWWMEIQSNKDGISDTENYKFDLLKIAYGVWDHIKNRDNHGYDNWELEWVGYLPGKRESRRYVGDYVLKQDDLLSGGKFYDVVAYGGWPIDIHGSGIDNKSLSGVNKNLKGLYGIPYRCLYSSNVENLFFAGRNISTSHVAFGSTRVLATCALMGQAVGNAVYIAKKYQTAARGVLEYVNELQKNITDDGVYLPYYKRVISQAVKTCKINISDEEKNILFNGVERPRYDGKINYIEFPVDKELILTFNEKTKINTLRLQFDPDFERTSISKHIKIQRFAMRMFKGKDFEPVKVSKYIVKDLSVYADGKPVFREENNYYSFLRIPLDVEAKELKLVFNETYGYDKIRLYSVDLID